MLGRTEILGWIRSFFDDEPSRAEGAPSLALVPAGTPVTVSAGCNASPCFVCTLRNTIERTLMRDRRLEGALRRDAEARARGRRSPQQAGAGVVAPPAARERPLGSVPLELHLIGLRREGSISDEFDDCMLVVTRLPDAETLEQVKKAVEPELLDALQRAAGGAPQAVRVVSCSGGVWLVGKFAISTDPGLAARKEDLRSSLALIEKQIEENRTALEEMRKRKKELDETELPKAKDALDAANRGQASAEKALADAKDAFEKELGKSRNIRPELTRLQQAANTRRDAVKGAKREVAAATREHGAKTRAAAEAGKRVTRLESAAQGLRKRQGERKAAFEAAVAARAKSSIGLKDENEGWLTEGRALMLPGHFENQYRFFVHLSSSAEAFSKNTSLAALTTTTLLHGLRAYSGRHLRANPKDFASGEYVSEVRSPDSAPRRYLTDEAVLAVTRVGATATIAVRETAAGKETPLGDDDVVLLVRSVGGTNIHRAHNAPGLPGADGRLHGPPRPTLSVSNWSEGCQVFPSSDEFNLFISLCAVSKRWRCVSQKKDCAAECRVLEVGAGEALGAGERALVTRFGVEFIGKAADINRGAKDPVIDGKINRIKALTWNEEDQAKLTELMKKKAEAAAKKAALSREDDFRIADLEAKKSRRLTESQQQELTGLEADRAKWRREYLREKTRRLAADHLRACDVLEKCGQRLSYTLIEMPSAELDALDAAFKESRNRGWSGSLA
jgi:hypothetical protein